MAPEVEGSIPFTHPILIMFFEIKIPLMLDLPPFVKGETGGFYY